MTHGDFHGEHVPCRKGPHKTEGAEWDQWKPELVPAENYTHPILKPYGSELAVKDGITSTERWNTEGELGALLPTLPRPFQADTSQERRPRDNPREI